jgi:hypothetical protein
MDIQLLMWVLFWVAVTVALFIDLVILNQHHGNLKTKSAANSQHYRIFALQQYLLRR